MERFEGTIPPTYFRSAKVVIFVYSIADDTIDDISSWTDSVTPQRLGGMDDLIRVLVGNKVDLEGEREVTTDRGKEVAKILDIDMNMFFEISALEGIGFDEMFEDIVRKIREDANKGKLQTTLSLDTEKSRKCGCGK